MWAATLWKTGMQSGVATQEFKTVPNRAEGREINAVTLSACPPRKR